MVHGFNKKRGVPVLVAGRNIKARFKVFRIYLSLAAVMVFVSTVPVGAFETTEISALKTEEIRAVQPLSFKKSPLEAQADPCLPLLHARHLSPGASALSPTSRYHADKTAAPVALGVVFGVRIALGSKRIVKPSQRVQIGPEFLAGDGNNGNYALSVAAYRNCKNEHTLDLHKRNNNNADF